MVKSYSFEEQKRISLQGLEKVCNYLVRLPETNYLGRVHDNPDYSSRGIDLLWVCLEEISVNVWVDFYTSGNFFLETISNEKKGTPGAFVNSEADLMIYYIQPWQTIYQLPLKPAQEWFKNNQNRFKERRTTTRATRKRKGYTTVGRIVPIDILMREVDDTERIIL